MTRWPSVTALGVILCAAFLPACCKHANVAYTSDDDHDDHDHLDDEHRVGDRDVRWRAERRRRQLPHIPHAGWNRHDHDYVH